MKDVYFKQFIVVFLIALLFCIGITIAYINNKSIAEYAIMEQVVLTRANKVSNVLTKLLYKSHILSALVIQSNGKVANFNDVAAKILDDPAIKNVILAPDGKVSAVYPLEGNKNVLGLDYFAEGRGNIEAVKARDSGQLVLGGPFTLVQGGEALVGRLPVYISDNETKRFWGIVSVTLNYPQVLADAELAQLKNLGFAFEIWRINPDSGNKQVIARSNYEYNPNALYVEQPLNIQNAEWFFRLSPIRKWYQYTETWVFLFIGIIISGLIARLVQHNGELKNIRKELEKLSSTDVLTGLLNRRGLLNLLDNLFKVRGTEFLLCYIDLNKFKCVNDNYGHNLGDGMLTKFTEIITAHNSNMAFARIGGDEFVVVFYNCSDKNVSYSFFDSIKEDCKQAVKVDDNVMIDISFSLGIARYPHDGTSANALIGFADRDMYKMKMSKK